MLIALATFNGEAVQAEAAAKSHRFGKAGNTIASAPAEHRYDAPQVVQFNVWGGKGHAFDDFNTLTVDRVVASIESRDPFPFIISFNEICESHYAQISWVLNSHGYGYSPSNPWGYDYAYMLSLGEFFGSYIGTRRLDGRCGQWYGNALLMRGQFVGGGADWYPGSMQDGRNGELRNWICKSVAGGGPAGCSTHLAADASSYTFQQATEYRNIAAFVSGNGVFALGDFNYRPDTSAGEIAQAAWAFAGFTEADGTRSTTIWGYHLDYIWRRNSGSFPHPAYIGDVAPEVSDHDWYQGYW